VSSTALDRFTINGGDGVFMCSRAIAARTLAEAARPPAPVVTNANGKQSLGLAAQADIRGDLRPTLLLMPQTQQRLQAMVDRLAAAWPYPNAPHPRVLMSANLAFNAEARLDNTLIVWIGVFDSLGADGSIDITDNDLYWLLGHEYSHLALNHGRRDDAAEAQHKALHDLAQLYQRGAMLDASFRYAQGAANARMQEEFEDSMEAHRRLRFLIDSVAQPAWGRIQEDEADTAGYDVAALAGYRPRYGSAMTQFEISETQFNDRVAAVRDGMAKRATALLNDPGYKAAVNQGDLGPAISAMGEEVKKGFMEGARQQFINWLKRDHRAAKQRAEGLSRYEDAAYAQANIKPVGGLVSTETQAIVALPELREGLTASRSVRDAQAALNAVPMDIPAARKNIDAALKTRFAREAYVRLVAAKVELADHHTDAAIRHLEAARASPNVSPDAYRELARLYATGNRIPAAKSIVAEGKAKSQDPDYFLPEDVRILVRSHQLNDVPPLLDACRATKRDQVMLDCQNALMDLDQSKLTEEQKRQFEDLAYWGAPPKKTNTGNRQINLQSLFGAPST
jgi:hypothetical protein